MGSATVSTVKNAAQAAAPLDVVLRPLAAGDLDAVVQLDKRVFGHSRRAYFERRLKAALDRPKRHLQFALTAPQGLIGFLLARVAGGEYGSAEEVAVLEAVGLSPDARHLGLGVRLLEGLAQLAASRGIRSLTTQVDWRNHSMLAFLDHAGFRLAPRVLVQRKVDRIPLPQHDEDIERVPPIVRPLTAADFTAIHRIDRRITGKDRGDYLKRKFDEALTESAIPMSLVALFDGLPVAFAMARVDHGDFGHFEPVAALETLGVDPDFKRQGFGRAVLEQLIENLAALHVEQLETEVPRESFDLLGFLYGFGFEPSQRLCFTRSQTP